MRGLQQIIIVYAIAIPLALVMGYALSDALSAPDEQNGYNYLMVALALFVLLLPVFMKWHHMMLVFAWNAVLIVAFLPSQPRVWLVLALLSFGISWLNGLLGGARFLRVPELTRPMVFLGVVVIATGYLRGGIGIKVLGNASYGGKNYIYILGAILGYFAFSAMRIPLAKARRAAGIFVLSGVSGVVPNIALMLGPAFYFLFYLVPIGTAQSQATAESGMQPGAIDRIGGVSYCSVSLVCYFLMRWGIRGIFSYAHPWRIILLILTLLLSLLGGFRTVEIMIGLILVCQFCCEGLWRSRFLPMLAGFGILSLVMVFAFSEQLPLAAQRALSFLPVKVDASVQSDAGASVEWRLQMWRILVPQIPKYLLLGKGYAIDPEELYFAGLGGGAGDIQAEASMVAGDYHSGPLSTIIPLGMWGVIGLLWLLGAGVKVLYYNYRYGDPSLHKINTFFLAWFIAQSIFFFGVFGAFDNQLYAFAGLLGMSVSLNGGVRRPGRIMAKASEPVSLQAPVSVPA